MIIRYKSDMLYFDNKPYIPSHWDRFWSIGPDYTVNVPIIMYIVPNWGTFNTDAQGWS